MNKTQNAIKVRHLLLFNNNARELVSLTQDKYNIGRHLSNEIVVNGDPISRIHARLHRTYDDAIEAFQYHILDGATDEKPSKNGIFVNDSRCSSYLLRSGDVISFANVIKSVYIQTNLNDADFERFQAEIDSDHCKFSAFLDDKTAIAVESNLSNPEYTTIMLGSAPISSKGTICQEL